ncbi:hypothetical protein PMAYCL1PPCAC_30915, partial [Pristionchus mayeri]
PPGDITTRPRTKIVFNYPFTRRNAGIPLEVESRAAHKIVVGIFAPSTIHIKLDSQRTMKSSVFFLMDSGAPPERVHLWATSQGSAGEAISVKYAAVPPGSA